MARTLLRMPEVIRRTGSSTTDIYTGMKNGTFPKSVPIGRRSVGWVDEEVDDWIERRIALRSTQPKHRAGPGRGHKGPMGDAEVAA
jgi:prophage regulatory protein